MLNWPCIAQWSILYIYCWSVQEWSHAERLLALDELIELCEPTQVRHLMAVIEPQFQRDFISLLPKEVGIRLLANYIVLQQFIKEWPF